MVLDDTKHLAVALQICRQLRKEKMVNEVRLHQAGRKVWKLKVLVEYSYGWIGTRCHTTTNYELQEDIFASEDGEIISPPMVIMHAKFRWENVS